jgi:hypothetical protein
MYTVMRPPGRHFQETCFLCPGRGTVSMHTTALYRANYPLLQYVQYLCRSGIRALAVPLPLRFNFRRRVPPLTDYYYPSILL